MKRLEKDRKRARQRTDLMTVTTPLTSWRSIKKRNKIPGGYVQCKLSVDNLKGFRASTSMMESGQY